jgi:hypothetical protein
MQFHATDAPLAKQLLFEMVEWLGVGGPGRRFW